MATPDPVPYLPGAQACGGKTAKLPNYFYPGPNNGEKHEDMVVVDQYLHCGADGSIIDILRSS